MASRIPVESLVLLAAMLSLFFWVQRYHKRLSVFLNILPAGIILQNARGKVVAVSPMAERLLGLTRAQLMALEPVDPEWRAVFATAQEVPSGDSLSLQNLLAGKTTRDAVIGVSSGTARRRWLSFNSSFIPVGFDWRPGMAYSFTDVSETNAEREMLEVAVEGATMGTWDWHVLDGHVKFNRQWWQILGYAPPQGQTSVDAWTALVHPDDLVEARRVLSQHFADSSVPYRCEFRMLRSDGAWTWVFAAGSAVERDKAGQVVRMAGVHLDISERKRLQQELVQAARTALNDPLTGLLNREGLKQRFVASVDPRTAIASPCKCLFLCGFDRFGSIVESLGLQAGEELLRQIAIRLQQLIGGSMPDVFAELNTSAAHMERGNFAILLHPLRTDYDALGLAEGLRAVMSQPHQVLGHRINCSFSLGISFSDNAQTSLDVMLRNAEIAMHEAKRLGRGRCVLFTSDMHERVIKVLSIEEELRVAIGKPGELYVAYQPIVELSTGRLVGAEALARWQHPARGAISPVEFIPIAEQTGLILELGAWILRTACYDMVQWRALHGEGAPQTVSANLSRVQIIQGTLPKLVSDVLSETGLPAACLRLEMTESMAMLEDSVLATLTQLRALGISMALDDFGTGYSSLASLDQMALDVVKIDRSFVWRMSTSAYQTCLIEAAIKVSASLNLKVVAEGVENEQQANTLWELGCDYAQGYLYGRPVVSSELRASFRRYPAVQTITE